MSSLDNILRTMNEYIADIFNMYGGQSQEYTTALRQVRENISDEVLQQVTRQGLDYTGDKPDKAFQFSRGQKATELLKDFAGDLENLRKEQRTAGTAKTQAQKYYTEQKLEKPDTPVNIKWLREQAADRFDWNNNVNDWYEAITKSDMISETEKDKIKAEYKKIQLEYEDVNFRDALRKKAENSIAQIEKAKAAKKAIEAAQAATGAETLGIGLKLGDII